MLFDKFIDNILAQEQKATPINYLTTSGQSEGVYSDTASYAKVYESIIWVSRCISLIATNIASLPILIYKYDNVN